MDYYLDIHIRSDPEFSVNMLMGALVSKLHRRLVALESQNIGISLPAHETKPPLGDVLRIHGHHVELGTLMETDWFTGLREHIVLSDIGSVSGDIVHRVVRRRQFKTNVERLRRRRMKRHQESYEEACERVPESVERQVSTPYVTIRSQSTGQSFSLFIEHGTPRSEPTEGRFSKYGLSDAATIPWF